MMKYSISVALLCVLVLAAWAGAEPPTAKIVLQSLSPTLISTYGLPAGTRGSSGISTVGVGTAVYLDAGGTDPDGGKITGASWTLTAKPAGSTAALVDGPMGWKMLVPDKRGPYTVKLTVTDDQGETSAPVTQVITAGVWVGVGTVGGATPNPGIGQCGLCHKGKTDAWAQTGHASMLQGGLDGIVSSHYGANCIACHTVGYDKDPLAVNGGFDDVATETGWTFPDTLKAGNFAAMPPKLKAVANIQCENCHGPGSEHIGNPTKIAMSLDAGNCGVCHDSGSHHIKNAQWRESKHAVVTASPSGPGRESCVRCHTGWGFVDFAEGNDPPRTEYAPIACAACHDPHDATNEHQVRLVDDVELGNGAMVTFGGPSKLCMNCHKSRRDAEEYAKEYHSHYGPHHGPQADMLAGTNAIQYGATIGSSMHRVAVEEGCVGCHMAPTPETGAGLNKVGAHTFAMAWEDPVTGGKVENVAACEECHGEMEEFDRRLGFDYDGDGAIEGVQSEVKGLLHTLGMALPPIGDPEVTVTQDYTPAQLKAAYNYFFVEEDGSFGIHNAHYALGLLQLAIRDLTGGLAGGMITANLPVTSAIAGQILTVPITVDHAAGVAGADVVVTYDPTILTAVSAQGARLGADLTTAYNVSEGRIAIAAAGVARTGVGGGTLLSVTFQVASGAAEGGVSDLIFASIALRDINGSAVLSAGQAGSVTIRAMIVGDVNNDGSVDAGDAILTLRIAVGLLKASDYQKVVADVNQDGAINSADVILILRKAVGLPLAKGIASLLSPKVEILSPGGPVGELMVVPIRLSEAAGIAGGDLSLIYDSGRLTPIRVEAEDEGILAFNLNDPGRVRIGWARADGLDRSEMVLNVLFQAQGKDAGSLRLEDVALFDPTGHLASTVVDGMTFVVVNRLPERFVLSQNFPNPFNAETTIHYQLPVAGEVSLVIYGTAGQVVRTLVAGLETAGYKTVVWDGRDDAGRAVAGGMYVYRFTVGSFTSMKKMLLLK